MTDHDRAIQLAAISIDFDLTPAERVELDEHLAACSSCTTRAAETRSDAAGLSALPRYDAPERVRAAVVSGRRAPGWRPVFAARALVVAVLAIAPLALTVVALRELNFSFGLGAGAPAATPSVVAAATTTPTMAPPTSAATSAPTIAPTITWQRDVIPAGPGGPAFEVHAVTSLRDEVIVTVGVACADLVAQTACRAASAVTVDGSSWARSVPDPALAVEALPDGSWVGMRDAVAGGPAVVAVGVTGNDGQPRAAVWLSSDGIGWDRVADDPGFADAWMNSVVSLDDGTLLAVGGAETASGSRAAVWTSLDGRAWTRVPDDPAFDVGSAETITAGRPVAGIWDVVAGTNGLTAVGAGCPPGQACKALAWISADGRSWTRLPDTTLGDGGATTVTRIDGAFLAVGQRQSGGMSWRSTESGPWTLRALPPARSGGLLAAAPVGPRVVAAGASGAERSGTWTTHDGLSWTFERGELFDGATVVGLIAAGDLVVAVGAGGDGHGLVWFGREISPAT